MLRLPALCVLLLVAASSAHGISSQFELIVDLDGNPNTGCEFPTSAGVFQGADVILVTHVETDGLDQATVVGVERRDCVDPVANVFGPPQMISGGGWPVGIGNGDDGFNVVETFLPLLPAQGFSDIRLGVVATDELGNSSVLISTLSGEPIVLGGEPPLPVPLVGKVVLLLLALLLLGVGILAINRRGRLTLTALVCLSAGGVAGAACVLDGEIFEWSLFDRLAQGSATDPTSGVDLRSLYGKNSNNQLCFRIDTALVFAFGPAAVADDYIVVETALLNIDSATGLLANDDLAIPEAVLVSFGGGELGGVVTDHGAGDTVAFADGSLTVNADGSFDFQAATGFQGDFTFDYRIENLVGDSDATVTIEVQATPEATDDAFETTTGELLEVPAPGVLDNDSGLPDPTVVSFGGGDLGGAVDDHAAGSTVAIAPDGDITLNADGSLSFNPATGLTGPFAFDYRIENAAGDAQATIIITVNDPPAITSANSLVCEVGSVCEFAFGATGFPEPTITLDGALPEGVTFNAATESLEGTPDNGTGAEYSLTVAANNGINPEATQLFTLTVNEAPAITSVDNLTCEVGSVCEFTFIADGFPDPTFDLPGLPAGLSLNGTTGELTGTPEAGTGAVHNLILAAMNGIAPDASQAFTLTINEAPTITSVDNLTCEVGIACNLTFTADGFPAPTFDLPGLPAGLSLDDNTGELTGTPEVGTGAVHNLTLAALNGIAPDASQAFTLTINEAPTITSVDNLTCEVGSACNFTFTADGFPDPTFDLPGLPAGLSLNGTTGELTGTPEAGAGAVHNLILAALNGIAPDASQAFTLTINEAPTITSAANLSCEVGSACNLTFTADGFPAPTFDLPGLPTGLSLNSTTGELTGTPDADTGAVYNLTLTAMNGIAPDDTQSFTLTVNEAPAITSAANLTCVLNEPCNFTFTADGFPAPTFDLPGLPSGLSLDAASGQLSGTPDTDGVFSLTLTATNTAGSDNQTFTLTVGSPPTITSADTFSCTVGSSCVFSFTADGIPDPTINVTGTLPAGVTFNAGDEALAGTPDAGTGAIYELTVAASNGVTPDASQNFTLTVNEAPVANDDPEGGIPGSSSPGSIVYHGVFNTSLNVSAAAGVLANDILGFPAAVIVTNSPIATAGGGSATLNADGGFSYTPATGFTGIDSFDYCIENTAAQDCATVAVAVGERPSAADAAYPQTLIGNVGIDTAVQSGFAVTAGGDGILLGVDSATNGNATVNANGTFTFNPAAGVTSANGTLVYSVSNGFGSATGTITIPIGANRIWFADTSAAAGDGRLGTPFNTLAAVATAANAAGDRIFLHTGTGSYTGGIDLLDNQRLLGQGAGQSLVVISGLTPPTDSLLPVTGGTAPTIVNASGNGVTLASGNHLHGLIVGNTSGSGVSGTGFGTLTVANVAITGTGQALNLTTGSVTGGGFITVSSSSGARNVFLTGIGGTLNLGTGSLSGATTTAFEVDAGTANISYGGSITATGGVRPVRVLNRTAGSLALSGAITGANGILLTDNTGSTIAFGGALNLNTGTNTAFEATGGGTITASGTGSILQTTTATALRVVNTTIGAGNLTFQAISAGTAASGPANGIVVNNTGTSGGLRVTGTGTAGSGGTIQRTSATGIVLTSTANADLARMLITNAGDHGINGTTVSTFSLSNSSVTNNGNAVGEEGINFSNLSGTVALTNVSATGNFDQNLRINNTSGTLSSLTITGGSYSNNNAINGNNGVLIRMVGNSQLTSANVSGVTIANNRVVGLFVVSEDTAQIGSFIVDNNTIQNNELGIDFSKGGSSSMTFSIINNSAITGHNAQAINVFTAAGAGFTGTLRGTIQNNTIGNSAVAGSGSAIGNCVRVNVNGDTNAIVRIDGNTLRECPNGRGVEVIGRNGTAGLDVTVTNNNIDHVNLGFTPGSSDFPLAAIMVQSNCATVCNTVRSDVRGNTVPGTSSFDFTTGHITLIETSTSTLELVDNPPGSASCAAQLSSNNTGSVGVSGGCSLIPGPISTP